MAPLCLYLKCTLLQQLCCNIHIASTLLIHYSSHGNSRNSNCRTILLEFLKSKLLVIFLNTYLLQPIPLELMFLGDACSLFGTNPFHMILGKPNISITVTHWILNLNEPSWILSPFYDWVYLVYLLYLTWRIHVPLGIGSYVLEPHLTIHHFLKPLQRCWMSLSLKFLTTWKVPFWTYSLKCSRSSKMP